MSFSLYAIGFAIAIGGLIYGAHLLHVPTRWIAVGAIVLLGSRHSDRGNGDAPERPSSLTRQTSRPKYRRY